jgi:hypothetical protein
MKKQKKRRKHNMNKTEILKMEVEVLYNRLRLCIQLQLPKDIKYTSKKIKAKIAKIKKSQEVE